MKHWENYHFAQDVIDVLHALAHVAGPARFIAGTTDQLLSLQQSHHSPVHPQEIKTSLVDYPNEEDLYGALFKGEADGIAPACMITNAYYNSAADCVDFLQVERRVIFEQLSWVGI
jgi:hypothetical protein